MQQGIQLHQQGQFPAAIQHYQKVLTVVPNHAPAHQLLGVIAHQQGDNARAEQLIRKAIKLNPELLQAYNNLGIVLRARNKLDAARDTYQKLIRLKPDYADAHNNLGIVLLELEDTSEAIKHFRKAIQLNDRHLDAWNSLGIALRGENALDEAISCYHKVIKLAPKYPEAHNNLGNVWMDKGHFDAAIESFQAAITLKPDYADAHSNLGNAFEKSGQLDKARQHFERALSLQPGNATFLFNCGLNLHERGNYLKADSFYQKALAADPNNTSIRSNALMLLNYSDAFSIDEVFKRHCQWEQFAKLGLSGKCPSPRRTLGKNSGPVRIGFVSPDFREHSVYYFFEPLLANLDTEKFETFCYYNHTEIDDNTGRIEDLSAHWRNVATMDDSVLMSTIAKDKIDILVDLAGHSAGHRLEVFCQRAAPIQVTWLGYPNTTGLSEMDYRISDSIADPEGDSDVNYSETLLRLDGGFLCYNGDASLAYQSALPVDTEGHITFGSFNNFTKLGPEVIRLWAQILSAVPASRLILKSKQLACPVIRKELTETFQAYGVAPERLDLLPKTASYAEHLALYNRIDIGLDPFPYNGTTTTLEALWMGVPSITLRGERHAGRVGASIMTRMALASFIAESKEDYLERAIRHSQSLDELRALRAGLRERLQTSSLCQAKAFARSVEDAFEKMISEKQS